MAAEISDETRRRWEGLKRAEAIVSTRRVEVTDASKALDEAHRLRSVAIHDRRLARRLWFAMPASERVALREGERK